MNPTGARKCRLAWGRVRRLSWMTSVWWFWCHFWHLDIIFTSSFHQLFRCQRIREKPKRTCSKCSYFSIKLIKQHILKPKCNCRKKSMQEKEPVMVVWFKLKIPSLGITVTFVTEFSIPTSWTLKILIVITVTQSLLWYWNCKFGGGPHDKLKNGSRHLPNIEWHMHIYDSNW